MKLTVLAAILSVGLGTAFATTTDSLELTVGTDIVTIQDNGSCVNVSGTACSGLGVGDINSIAGTDTISGTIDGWSVNIISGTSHSPGLTPYGLDVSSLTADDLGATAALDVKYSDINFSPASPSFSTTYSASVSGSGTTSESAYYSNCGAACSSSNLFAETTLIGTVGPLSTSGAGKGTVTGGTGSAAPYSLTLDQTFDNVAGTSYSVDGFVTGVPEPGAMALFGTVLVLCVSKLRRLRAS